MRKIIVESRPRKLEVVLHEGVVIVHLGDPSVHTEVRVYPEVDENFVPKESPIELAVRLEKTTFRLTVEEA